MSSFESQRQDSSSKRRWQENNKHSTSTNFYNKLLTASPSNSFMGTNLRSLQNFPDGFDNDENLLVPSAVPAVTVVLEGRSICQRINLDKHSGYKSLAKALRQMFVDDDVAAGGTSSDSDLDLSNAIPGHLIAYEDMENDLLLVGDLKWNDFVRVAKRIRILPVKMNSRKARVEN